jgi:1-aminocyclopropane-1-carboxylate deaminase/D-cysteine desulfhydrase-like pyridoxal-dependent ACC family enzyme
MIRASAERYAADMAPSLAELPRFELIADPSPLAPLPRLSAALGDRAELWIKREDLLPLAFGGNKLRNLEYLIGAALAEGADTLITAGRRWSNHCRLTAAAGAVAGLEVQVVLSGPATDPPNPGRRLDELLGARVHQLATADRAERDAMVQSVAAQVRDAGGRPYVIGVGGGGAVGAAGQVRAAAELIGQSRGLGIDLDAVVLPSATGATQAGLMAGLAAAGADVAVVGVAVAHPPAMLQLTIAALLTDLAELTAVPVDPGRIVVDGDQLGPGYGRPTRDAGEAGHLLATTEGLLVDPIYTAKALAGLIARVRAGGFDGQRVVFWHAGGLPGLFEPLEGESLGG